MINTVINFATIFSVLRNISIFLMENSCNPNYKICLFCKKIIYLKYVLHKRNLSTIHYFKQAELQSLAFGLQNLWCKSYQKVIFEKDYQILCFFIIKDNSFFIIKDNSSFGLHRLAEDRIKLQIYWSKIST